MTLRRYVLTSCENVKGGKHHVVFEGRGLEWPLCGNRVRKPYQPMAGQFDLEEVWDYLSICAYACQSCRREIGWIMTGNRNAWETR